MTSKFVPTYPRRVFVFGSNLKGRHGKGAALHAAKNYGAQEGLGYGPQGMAYAIPTKGYALEILPLSVIQRHVGYFINCVHCRDPNGIRVEPLLYNVTQIGCGLAGHKPHDIAPMFKILEEAPNVWFDRAWSPWLPKAKFWNDPI